MKTIYLMPSDRFAMHAREMTDIHNDAWAKQNGRVLDHVIDLRKDMDEST